MRKCTGVGSHARRMTVITARHCSPLSGYSDTVELALPSQKSRFRRFRWHVDSCQHPTARQPPLVSAALWTHALCPPFMRPRRARASTVRHGGRGGGPLVATSNASAMRRGSSRTSFTCTHHFVACRAKAERSHTERRSGVTQSAARSSAASTAVAARGKGRVPYASQRARGADEAAHS